MHVIGGSRDSAVLRKLAETRDADGQDDADHKHGDEQLIEREAVLVFSGHAGNIRMSRSAIMGVGSIFSNTL